MLFWPHIAHAQQAQNLTFEKLSKTPAVAGVVDKVMSVIVIPIIEGLVVFTILIFIWGVVQMIMNSDDSDARKTGQNHVLWGVIGLVIMLSAYGIIQVIANTIGVSDPYR